MEGYGGFDASLFTNMLTEDLANPQTGVGILSPETEEIMKAATTASKANANLSTLVAEPAKQTSWLDTVGKGVADFGKGLNTKEGIVGLGQMLGAVGAAVSPEGSWQRNLGAVGSQLNKNILAKDAQKRALAAALGRPTGTPGGTDSNFP